MTAGGWRVGGTHAGRQADWQRPGSNGAKILVLLFTAPSLRKPQRRRDASEADTREWGQPAARIGLVVGEDGQLDGHVTGQTQDRRALRAGLPLSSRLCVDEPRSATCIVPALGPKLPDGQASGNR